MNVTIEKVAGRGAINTRPAGQTFLERCSMSSISTSSFSFNPDGGLIGNTRFQSDHPSELSASFQADLETSNRQAFSDDPAIDALFVAEMERRDAKALAQEKARLTPDNEIQLSVGLAGGNKFAAAVRLGRKVYKLGAFKLESTAWIAARLKATELRRKLSLAI